MKTQYLKTLALQYGGLLLVLLAMVGVFSLQSENFFQRSTFTTIANQIPDLTLVAVGMTFVLVIGGIDLSVGSILALSSAVLGALMVDAGWPLWAAIPICLVSGAFCGLINGCVSIGFGIPSFIVTLGMLEIARGVTKVITDSQTKYIGSAVEGIGEPLAYIHFSTAFLLALGAVLAGQFLLSRTVFGRYLIAIGTNEEAVRMSGIRTAPYSIAVFVLSGLLCGLGGLVQASRLSSADPNAAIGLELSAIAACVIGGTSLMGGRGSVISSFIGVLIISVLQTGLAQLGVSDANKQIITGSVIVVAVLIDALRSKLNR
ncbi:ABC transporter permease [Blastopirellula sp. JC732]|uniref:ABC transporter permease n=1 Tax=Blastopirellula sediminis TaxID=2894196 RepID=A0A9X1MLS3_9BACT|nr:ABC transporter permease [Blastopirellula sediminis]MCC9608648.1 ABC transporter permease [Blastopirellula sediminis]MCC9628575.1 ABC transporter permease [Blastopirellula sediminis]